MSYFDIETSDLERQTGIQREGHLIGLSGMDAVILWEAWKKRKDQKAKDLLIQYC